MLGPPAPNGPVEQSVDGVWTTQASRVDHLCRTCASTRSQWSSVHVRAISQNSSLWMNPHAACPADLTCRACQVFLAVVINMTWVTCRYPSVKPPSRSDPVRITAAGHATGCRPPVLLGDTLPTTAWSDVVCSRVFRTLAIDARVTARERSMPRPRIGRGMRVLRVGAPTRR